MNIPFSTSNFPVQRKKKAGFPSAIFSVRRSDAGFTMIEMAVASGLFAVLALSAVSITIAVMRAQAAVQRIQSAIDNVRFSLELITKEMRVGSQYRVTNDCGALLGTDEITFSTSFSPTERRYFIQTDANGVPRLMRIKKGSAISAGDCASAVPLTAEDVQIDRFRVTLRGTAAGSSDGQPWARFNMKATARDPRGQGDFSMDLQTSVVQRIRDLP